MKSKFANALTLFFCEASGVMKAQGKPCIAYGSEAGYMDPKVHKIAEKMCQDTYFIARTTPSLEIIRSMNLQGRLGTDTAWTFPPASPDWLASEMKNRELSQKKETIGAAVINPFCWPVKPSISKWIKSKLTGNTKNHYDRWYFFSHSQERVEQLENYTGAIAKTLDMLSNEHGAQIVLIGMEALDLEACKMVQAKMEGNPPIFSSIDYDGYQLTALLHSLSALITSRYHARVLSMPAGVPAVAISMDERLHNLLEECGHLGKYYLDCHDPKLEQHLEKPVETMLEHKEDVSAELIEKVPFYLKTMGDMGKYMARFVANKFPQFQVTDGSKEWLEYLPPLYPALEKIVRNQ